MRAAVSREGGPNDTSAGSTLSSCSLPHRHSQTHHTSCRPNRSRSSSRSSMAVMESSSAATLPATNATKRAEWLRGHGGGAESRMHATCAG